MEWLERFIRIFEENQILMTVLGLSGAGILTFWIKDVPRGMFNILKREMTTEIVISSHHRVFVCVMRWIEKEYLHKKFRKLKVVSGGGWGDEIRDEDDNGVVISAGYGSHLIRYHGSLIWINMRAESANQTNADKDILTMVKLGRGNRLFRDLIDDAIKLERKKGGISLYRWNGYWDFVRHLRKRAIDSIYIEKEKKDFLLSSIGSFIQREDWYLKHGIPYQLGILLYGPPGTGKTSLINALSAHFERPIYYFPAGNMSSIQKAMANLPDNCFFVIEDIDMTTGKIDDGKDPDDEKHVPPHDGDDVLNKVMMRSYLSDVLNSLDGVFSPHGRILLATTNNIDNIDDAVIRPGRIDICMEIGYVNHEILNQFIHAFYGDDVSAGINIADNLTVAELQHLVLAGSSADDIINYVKIPTLSEWLKDTSILLKEKFTDNGWKGLNKACIPEKDGLNT